MKFIMTAVLSVFTISFVLCPLRAMSGKPASFAPLKPSKMKVSDGEFLRYGNYTGGEKTQESYIVTRTDTVNNTAEIYWQNIDMNNKTGSPLPVHYTNFNTYHYTFDLLTGSMLSSSFLEDRNNIKGLIRSSITLNKDKNEIESAFEFWDGYESKISRPKLIYKKGFPVCDMNCMSYISRFLDISSPGIIYLCQPNVLKEPIPFSFIFLGREKVRTPAGTFSAIKAGVTISDPFLAKLFQPYGNELNIWIEDSPRMLFIKGVYAGSGEFILEEISTVWEKGMN